MQRVTHERGAAPTPPPSPPHPQPASVDGAPTEARAAPPLPQPPWPWGRLIFVVVLLALAWIVRVPLLVLFGGAVVSAVLTLMSEPLRRLGVGRRIAVVLVSVAVAAVAAVGVWQLGAPLSDQLQGLERTLPAALQTLQDQLNDSAPGKRVLQWFHGRDAAPQIMVGIADLASGAFIAVTGAALAIVVGVFLALDLPRYRYGLMQLLPPARRSRLQQAIDASGHALSRWLLGQGLLMLIIGVVTAIGMFMLGVPMPLALGLIAGLLEFVPFFGPIVSGLLAALVAFAQGPALALYVVLFFVVVQQVESNLLVPVVQRWTVRLPPVLALMSVLVFGKLFGLLGVLLGLPLMVVMMVLVRRLYVQAAPGADEHDDAFARHERSR